MIVNTNDIEIVVNALKEGRIVIMPTDTIYGFHCLYSNQKLIDMINEIKGREVTMPIITLISDKKDLKLFGVKVGGIEKIQVKTFWPGPNTLIFQTKDLGKRSFRLPNNEFLLSVLRKTGPLISTSANKHGMPHSKSIEDAVSYFGDKIDLYVDGGILDNPPSSIYEIIDETTVRIR